MEVRVCFGNLYMVCACRLLLQVDVSHADIGLCMEALEKLKSQLEVTIHWTRATLCIGFDMLHRFQCALIV